MKRPERLLQRLRRLIDSISDCIWPQGLKCLCCDEAPAEGLLCTECTAQLRQYRLHDAQDDVRSVWTHRGCPRQLVLGLKYECIEDCVLG